MTTEHGHLNPSEKEALALFLLTLAVIIHALDDVETITSTDFLAALNGYSAEMLSKEELMHQNVQMMSAHLDMAMQLVRAHKGTDWQAFLEGIRNTID